MSLLDQAAGGQASRIPNVPGLAVLGSDLLDLLKSYISQTTRLVELHPSKDSGIPESKLLVHRFSGFEAVNEGFRFEAEVLSADAFLELKELEGVPVQVTLLTASGAKRQINGVVMEVRSEGTDGSLAAYRLIIEPVTAALKHDRSSRIFLAKNDLEIALLLLQEQIQANPVFSACFSIDNRCKKTHPVREFAFMCDENAWDFLRRRLAKIGVSFVFAPAKDSSPEFPKHSLILFEEPQDLDENEAGAVRFHRADGTEQSDAITSWHARRSLQCGKVTRSTWNHARGATSTATEEVPSDQGRFGNALASTIEDYRHESPLEHDDLDAHEAHTATRSKGKGQLTKAFSGESSVRDFRAGTTFTLTQHPIHDQDPPESREFVLTRVELEAENNLPKGLEEGVGAIKRLVQDMKPNHVYRNRFECLRIGISIHPEEIPAPNPGLQTATVVGPGNEAVHTDEWGRCKVRLHCTRLEEHPEAGATGTDQDSFWIRSVHLWSSQGMGGNFPIRKDDEVMLGFLGNDPDKPVILGVLPGGCRPPGRFSDASCLPGDKAISGLRSRMHGGLAGNELLMDDTPQEIRARLASDHACTELNLGYNVHPRKNGSAAPKGEGAELRSDAAVAIRGGSGLYLSADPRPRGMGSQLSRDEALGHLGAALELAKSVGGLGAQHGMETLETKPQADLLEHATAWEQGTNTDPQAPCGKRPILLGSAPAGMAFASGDDTTLQAASNLDLVAMRHAQMSAGKRMLFHAMESIGFFAHRLGMKLIAAGGDVSIQAQSGLAELIAAKVLRLMSVGGPIELDAAEGIILRSGGAFLEIKNGQVKAGGTGGWLGQFGSVSWSGPASQNAKTRSFGQSRAQANEFFRVMHGSDPLAGIRYEITLENGQMITGRTDGDGRTQVAMHQLTQRAKLKLFPDDVAGA